jgi:hypothetical protein
MIYQGERVDVASPVTLDRFFHNSLVEDGPRHGRIARSSPVGFAFQTQLPIEWLGLHVFAPMRR